jgi:hypothetical protein
MGNEMTAESLGELRTVLVAKADTPIAILEAHPLPNDVETKHGLHLDAASPLPTHLSQLITQTSRSVPADVGIVGCVGTTPATAGHA